MIRINYIEDLIKKRSYSFAFIKILKILNFFVHLLIVLLVVGCFDMNNKIIDINGKIDKVKTSIQKKRIENNIDDKEKLWTENYYKLLAIREYLQKNTNYGLVFADLGDSFLKDKGLVLFASCIGDELKMSIYVKNDVIDTLSSFYDYSNILSDTFKDSIYIKKDGILIESVDDTDIDKFSFLKKSPGKVFGVKLSVLSRR